MIVEGQDAPAEPSLEVLTPSLKLTSGLQGRPAKSGGLYETS